MNNAQKGLAYICISLVSAATITIITKIALEHGGDPTRVLQLRYVLVFVFLLIYLKLKKIPLVVDRMTSLQLFLLGFAYANVSLLFFLAMKYISPSLGSLILYSYPAIVTILSALFLGEHLTRHKISALLLSAMGCFFVIGVDFSHSDSVGILLAFSTAIFFSLYIVGNKIVLKKVSPVVSLFYMSLFCVVFFSFKSLYDGTFSLNFNLVDVIAATLLAIIPTIIGIMSLFKALKILGASKSAIISSFEPVVTLVLAYFIVGDRISVIQIIGAAFILSSVLLIQNDRKLRKISIERVEIAAE